MAVTVSQSSALENGTQPHVSSIELEEGEIGLAGDAVETKDTVHDQSPNSDQTICNLLAGLPQPRARTGELPPNHVYHVILIIFLLQSHFLILT